MEKYIEELGKAYQTVKDDASLTEEIREKKLDALRETARRVAVYDNGHCYDPLILTGYTHKMCQFILDAQKGGEINEIMSPLKPIYDGNKLIDRKYQVDEEELLGLSAASLRVPLNGIATKRMLELMYRVFPKERLKALDKWNLG